MKSSIFLPILLLFWFQSTAQSIKDVQINGVEINEEASLMNDGYMIVDNATLSYLKFDFSGNLLWAKKFDPSSLNYLNSVVESVNGNLFFLGETPNFELIVIKTNATGTVLWSKIINRQESSYTMSKISVDEFENVYVMPSQETQISFLKFDTDGNELWSTTITCDPLKNPSFHYTILADGSIIGTGKADSDIVIYHIDKYGNIVMIRRFGGTFAYEYYCHATIMEQLNDNLFLTGGYFENPNGQSELLLMKTDSLANVIEAKTFFNPNPLAYIFYPFDCKILSDGNIAVAYDSGNGLAIAYFDQNFNFIKNLYMPDTYYYSFVFTGVSIKNDELIVPYYDSNFINRLMRFKLLNTDLTCGLIEGGNFTSSTYTFNPTNFSSSYTLGIDLTSSNITLTSSVITGITYSTYCGVAESELGIASTINETEISIYPNPANNFITLESGATINRAISIYDTQGKIVFESADMKNSIDVSKFESGVYLVRVVDGEKIYSEKFVKE